MQTLPNLETFLGFIPKDLSPIIVCDLFRKISNTGTVLMLIPTFENISHTLST